LSTAVKQTGLLGPIEVLPYRGYATPEALFMKGRVLEKTGITRSSATDTAVGTSLRNMVCRFASAELPLLVSVPVSASTSWRH